MMCSGPTRTPVEDPRPEVDHADRRISRPASTHRSDPILTGAPAALTSCCAQPDEPPGRLLRVLATGTVVVPLDRQSGGGGWTCIVVHPPDRGRTAAAGERRLPIPTPVLSAGEAIDLRRVNAIAYWVGSPGHQRLAVELAGRSRVRGGRLEVGLERAGHPLLATDASLIVDELHRALQHFVHQGFLRHTGDEVRGGYSLRLCA